MSVVFQDNSDEYIKAKNAAVKRVLESLGVHLEGEAKDELENKPRRVDTGRLKGSIVYATAETHNRKGQPPSKPLDYRAHDVPEEDTVYVGTNVRYAPYVHEGTVRMKPNRFLKNAFKKNEDQIKEYIAKELKETNDKMRFK